MNFKSMQESSKPLESEQKTMDIDGEQPDDGSAFKKELMLRLKYEQ